MWAFIKHVKLFCVLLLNLDMRGLKLPGSAQRTTVSSLTVFMNSWVGFQGVVVELNNKEHLLIFFKCLAKFSWFSVVYLFCSVLWFLMILLSGSVLLNLLKWFVIVFEASVRTRGGKSTKILYSSKSTITLLKFYLSTSKSTNLKIYSSKSKK